MNDERIFNEFMSELETYLKSKFEGLHEHEVMELAAYISNRVIVLTADLTNEHQRMYLKEMDRHDKQLRKYYEHLYGKKKGISDD